MADHLTIRGSVALMQVAVMQLLEAAGLTDINVTDVSVNFDGRSMRIDIARLTPDGLHIEEWLRGYTVDPQDLKRFGTPVGLPHTDGATH